MTIVVSSSKLEKVFDEKDVINIGTNPNCDFHLDVDFDVLLTLQYDKDENKCVLMNTFHNDRVLFKGKPIKKVEIGNICKIMFAGSPEFINIKIVFIIFVVYGKLQSIIMKIKILSVNNINTKLINK